MHPIVHWIRQVEETGGERAITVVAGGEIISGTLVPFARYTRWRDELHRRGALAGGPLGFPAIEIPPLTDDERGELRLEWEARLAAARAAQGFPSDDEDRRACSTTSPSPTRGLGWTATNLSSSRPTKWLPTTPVNSRDRTEVGGRDRLRHAVTKKATAARVKPCGGLGSGPGNSNWTEFPTTNRGCGFEARPGHYLAPPSRGGTPKYKCQPVERKGP